MSKVVRLTRYKTVINGSETSFPANVSAWYRLGTGTEETKRNTTRANIHLLVTDLPKPISLVSAVAETVAETMQRHLYGRNRTSGRTCGLSFGRNRSRI